MNELGRDKVFIINKTFPGFEKEFLKNYGKNNTKVSPDDFIILIDRYIDGNDTPSNKVKEVGIVVAPLEVQASTVKPQKFTRFEDEDNGITFELIEKDTTLLVKNSKNNIEVFLSLGERESGLRRVMYRYDFSDVGKPLKRQNKTESFPSNFKKVFLDYLEMTKEQIVHEFGPSIKEKSLSSLLVNKFGLQEPTFGGMGIKELKTKVPPVFIFGKINLLLDKLYYKNVLAIKDKNMQNIQGIPNKRVSNEFVDLIMKIINDVSETTKEDIYSLDEKEQELYNILMYKSGFYKEGKTKLDTKNVIKRLKSRLALVEGEIKAGNDNTDNFKELYSILFKLCNLGAVSLSEGRKYYKEIVKQYS
jgi:hypothetical protein